jgi:YNFM family putative membrane transporter
MNFKKHNIDSDFFIFIWMSFVTFAGFYGPQPLLSTISISFQVSQFQAGLLMTFAIAPFAVGPFVYSHLLRSFSIRRLLRFLILCATCSLIPPVFATWFPVLLASRLFQGVILSALLSCLTTIISSNCNVNEIQRKMTLYATATTIGAFGGRVFCGYIGSCVGWRFAFLILAFFQLSSLFLITFLRIQYVEVKNIQFSFNDIYFFLKNPMLRSIIFIAPLCIFCNASFMNLIPFYLRYIDNSVSDSFIGLFYISGVFSAFIGIISDKILNIARGEWNLILIGFFIFAIAILLLFFHNMQALIFASIMSSLAFAIIYTTFPGIINRVSTKPKSLTNSVYIGIYYSFSAMGTFIPILVFSFMGINGYVFLILGCIIVGLWMTIQASRSIRLGV